MRYRKFSLCAAALFATAGAASATPLRLDYCVTALGGGQYQYRFTLTLDNHDGSWAAGQAWRWFIWGDGSAMSSPLTNWVGDPASLPVGPWTGYTSSGGGHNGPTFDYVLDYWTPAAVGDSLTWRGTSTANLPEPTLLFSTLAGTLNGGVAADFEAAHRLPSCDGQSSGACCGTDGSCFLWTGADCTAIGGIYRGNNTVCATANCPLGGACCLASGSCTIHTGANCTAQSGVYRGDGAACATANCPHPQGVWVEQGDADELPATAQAAVGGGVLNEIRGSLNRFTDADMYKIRMCDPANFSAAMTGFNFGAELFLFKADGTGIANRIQYNGPATITNQFTSSLPAGDYYLAAAAFLKMPQDASGTGQSAYLWITNHYDNVERAPDGPAAANPIDHWDNSGGVDGVYSIALTGACFVGGAPPVCYANCDHSTTLPCLNVIDFQCFLNQFAAGAAYANCDNSTTPPVLNVLDFQCFLNRFAAGCSNC